MADLNSIITSSTASTTVNSILTLLILIILGGLFFFWRWYKSFNIAVEIRRPVSKGGAYVFERGLKGRYTFKTTSEKEKVTVFQIMGARARKLEFNGDAPDERYKIVDVDKKGKVSVRVIFQPDSENQLHPVYLKQNTMGEIEAAITRADYQFAATSIKEINDKYNEEGFISKYGFLIFMVLFLLTAVMYWFASKNYIDSAAQMASANTALAGAFQAWTAAVTKNATMTQTAILVG